MPRSAADCRNARLADRCFLCNCKGYISLLLSPILLEVCFAFACVLLPPIERPTPPPPPKRGGRKKNEPILLKGEEADVRTAAAFYFILPLAIYCISMPIWHSAGRVYFSLVVPIWHSAELQTGVTLCQFGIRFRGQTVPFWHSYFTAFSSQSETRRRSPSSCSSRTPRRR